MAADHSRVVTECCRRRRILVGVLVQVGQVDRGSIGRVAAHQLLMRGCVPAADSTPEAAGAIILLPVLDTRRRSNAGRGQSQCGARVRVQVIGQVRRTVVAFAYDMHCAPSGPGPPCHPASRAHGFHLPSIAAKTCCSGSIATALRCRAASTSSCLRCSSVDRPIERAYARNLIGS